jgi:hypothetical protein
VLRDRIDRDNIDGDNIATARNRGRATDPLEWECSDGLFGKGIKSEVSALDVQCRVSAIFPRNTKVGV